MVQETKATTDHETIRRWIEERDGRPARLADDRGEDAASVLRVDLPDSGEEGRLEELSWDDFFQRFEEAQLAFLYQDDSPAGGRSNFCRFVGRDSSAARRAS